MMVKLNSRSVMRPRSLEDERWLPVVGYEDRYDVSDMGRVWSKRNNIVLRAAANGRGYLTVALCRGGVQKTFYVHDLVIIAFKGPKPAGHDVDHDDTNKANCRASNLFYRTHADNCRRYVQQSTLLKAEA